MKKILKILIGFILFAMPFYFVLPGMALEAWGKAAMDIIKGGITLLIPLIGFALIILGFSEIKD